MTTTTSSRTMTILSICAIPIGTICVQIIWQKMQKKERKEHSKNDELAKGPIMPLSLGWYLLSNYLCATASYHCTSLSFGMKLYAAFGLMVGGEGHIRETIQYLNGSHKPFMYHLEKYGNAPPLWVMLFGINVVGSSLLGIYYFMFEWIRENQKASFGTKVTVSSVLLVSTVYELYWQQTKIKKSTVKWHYLHIMVTHVGLSLMPPMIVWYYYPNIDLLALPWTRSYPHFSHKNVV